MVTGAVTAISWMVLSSSSASTSRTSASLRSRSCLSAASNDLSSDPSIAIVFLHCADYRLVDIPSWHIADVKRCYRNTCDKTKTMTGFKPMSKLIQWLNENTLPVTTLKDIAGQLKVDPSLVSLWRQGKRKPGKRQLKNLSRLIGIKIEDLL